MEKKKLRGHEFNLNEPLPTELKVNIDKKRNPFGNVMIDMSPCGSFHNATIFCRKSSKMTKDLIKLEMRCRVLSFRPTMQSLFVLHFGNYLHKASSRGKVEEIGNQNLDFGVMSDFEGGDYKGHPVDSPFYDRLFKDSSAD